MTSFALHILAMILMLGDHLWATIVPGNAWLTFLGRLAFPIFAFLLVEGYHHTHDLKKYVQRLLVLAIVSELPFNLMYGGSWIYPFHQNVIWTYLIGIGCMVLIDKAKKKENTFVTVLSIMAVAFLGYLLGTIAMVDYYGYGILMILTFYVFYGNDWKNRILQLACMIVVNAYLMRGLTVPINLFGHEFLFVQQSMAVLALIPIWLYNGQHGYYNRMIREFYYWFYPVHILILALMWLYM